jgi:hypothetical protein
MGFEPMTSSLPRKCSTTELKRLKTYFRVRTVSGRRGSNPRPAAWKAAALPAELLPQLVCTFKNVGVTGLEPMNPKEVSYSHPQLPLCDTPILINPGRLPELRRKSTGFSAKSKRVDGNFFPSYTFVKIRFSYQTSNNLILKSNYSTFLTAHLFPFRECHATFL